MLISATCWVRNGLPVSSLPRLPLRHPHKALYPLPSPAPAPSSPFSFLLLHPGAPEVRQKPAYVRTVLNTHHLTFAGTSALARFSAQKSEKAEATTTNDNVFLTSTASFFALLHSSICLASWLISLSLRQRRDTLCLLLGTALP